MVTDNTVRRSSPQAARRGPTESPPQHVRSAFVLAGPLRPAGCIRRVVRKRVSARRAGRSAQTSPRRALRIAKKGSRRVLPVEIHKRRQRPTFPLSSIIGGRSLTTVFGMGTGVASHLWSPTNPAAGLHRRPVVFVVRQTSRTERTNAQGTRGVNQISC